MHKFTRIAIILSSTLTFAEASLGQICAFAEQPATACTTARVIDGYPGHHIVMMDVSTATGTSSICGGITTGHNVWFEVTPVITGPMTITTCHPATQYDTVLEVYSGGDANCNSMTLVSCNDDDQVGQGCVSGCAAPLRRSSGVTIQANAGVQYRFVVGCFGTIISPPCQPCLGMRVSIGAPCGDPPNNLDSTLATALPGEPGVYLAQVDVTDAVKLAGEPNPACVAPEIGHSVWYSVTPTEDGRITASTCSTTTNFDTVAAIYEDGGGGLLVHLDCDDDNFDSTCINSCDAAPRGSQPSVDVAAGSTYLIQVGSYNDNSIGCPTPLCLGIELVVEDVCSYDLTPPEVALFAPPELTAGCMCPNVTIDGWAYDPDGTFDEWIMEYRAIGSSTWNGIAGSSGEVPQPGGAMALWQLGVPQGYYVLRLTAQNICSRTSSVERVVWVDTGFDTVQAATSGGTVVGGQACVGGTVTDNFCFSHYVAEYRPFSGGAFLPVNPNFPIYTSGVINSTLATWQTAGLSDGDYELRIAGETNCGDGATVTFPVAVDNTPPTSTITGPLNCDIVDGVVQIVGTANDANLSGWSLQYTGGASNGWNVINTGTTSVIDGVLGAWDVSSLPACAYALRLVASDEAARDCNAAVHNTTEFTTLVLVGFCRGDFNYDTQFNSLDIQGFVDALLAGEMCP